MPFFTRLLQSLSSPRGWAGLLVLFLCLQGLAACGKRPPDVDPPEGAKDVVYPRTYPDPMGDR